jgi:hypothetical protein
MRGLSAQPRLRNRNKERPVWFCQPQSGQDCRLSQRPALASHRSMELWQRLGYNSFGDWRRASEKARRDAKKAKVAPAALARWRPTQPLAPPLPPAALLQPPPSDAKKPEAPDTAARSCGVLPGQLREDILVTPRGRRRHSFSHSSPGGTTRLDEYFSPPGAQRHACEQRLECLHRLAAARRADTRADIFGCRSCQACQEFASAFAKAEERRQCRLTSLGRTCTLFDESPSAMKRSRHSCGPCEQWSYEEEEGGGGA